jgi:hypothetical protein
MRLSLYQIQPCLLENSSSLALLVGLKLRRAFAEVLFSIASLFSFFLVGM